MSNRLIEEKSPYLLQHAENPVDWYAWSDEAFERAKNENKPVFLSVGYATCHWCHVMAHESFENEEVARLLNETFINIKVDREERPDIDNTYMTVCQLLTGQGGWPLTIVMTPDKKPFFAATYIPKVTRFNRLGMKELIPKISKAWKEERNKVLHSANRITSGFKETLNLKKGDTPGQKIIKQTRDILGQRFDPVHGGFNSKPKFPSPHNLLFLLQFGNSYSDNKAAEMAHLTLDKMRLGGMFDHIGFGFHRYSTDSEWLLPHFEKMLYDQALLMLAYTEAARNSGDSFYRDTVYQIADYVFECLTSDLDGFFSAEDADSEGEEGKFYIWTTDEIQSVLSEEDFQLFFSLYNLEDEGNFKDESTGQKNGTNIPHLKKRFSDLASDLQMEENHLVQRVDSIRKKLKTHRDSRIRPLLDDKVLTDWNGLMIAALSRAGFYFSDPRLIEPAENAWKFISRHMISTDGKLYHRFREGDTAIQGMADDYAFLIWGLLELYQATSEPGYLKHALSLNETFLEQFRDKESGGFYFTPDENEELLGRQKEIYDGAIPSSNSVAAMNLIRLGRLTGETELEDKAEEIFQSFSSFIEESPASATHAIHAFMTAVQPAAELVVCGRSDEPEVNNMIQTFLLTIEKPFVFHQKNETNNDELSALVPWLADFPVSDTPTAYLCHQFKCEKPVHSAGELKKLILDSSD
jgi:uncharacterized protein